MSRALVTAGLLAVPLAGLFLLLGVPDLDVAWEHQPSHFWLMLLSALLSFLLGLLMAEAAGRRGRRPRAARGARVPRRLELPGPSCAGDARRPSRREERRLPDRLRDRALIAAGFAAASAIPLGEGRARAVLRERRLLLASVAVSLGVWAILALGTLPPLEEPITPEAARDPLLVLWALGMALRLRRLPLRAPLRHSAGVPVALAVASACSLPRRCSPSRSRATGT